MPRRLYLLFFFIIIMVAIGFLPDLTGSDRGKFPCAAAEPVTQFEARFTTDDTLTGRTVSLDDFSIGIWGGEWEATYGGDVIPVPLRVGDSLFLEAEWSLEESGDLDFVSATIDGTPVSMDYPSIDALHPGESRTVTVHFNLIWHYEEDSQEVYFEVPVVLHRDPPPQITIDGVDVLTEDDTTYVGSWRDGRFYEGEKRAPVLSSSVSLAITMPEGVYDPLTNIRKNIWETVYYTEESGSWTAQVPLDPGDNTIEMVFTSLDIEVHLARIPFSGLTVNGNPVNDDDISSEGSTWWTGPVTVTGETATLALQADAEGALSYQVGYEGQPVPMTYSTDTGRWMATIPLARGNNPIVLRPSEQNWSLTIDITRIPLGDLKVNGIPVNISGEGSAWRAGPVTVTGETATLVLQADAEYALSCWVREGEETLMTDPTGTGQWTATIPLALGSNTITLLSEQDWQLEIFITREEESPPPPSGGGGGGGASTPPAPPPSTPGINIDPSSNTLQPSDTRTDGDSSTSRVSDDEVNALLEGLAGSEGEDTVAQIQLGSGDDEGIDNYSLEISGNALNQLGGSAGAVGVLSPVGDIYLRNEAVEGMGNRAADTITISMSRIQHEGRPGISVNIRQGDNPVATFAGTYTAEIRVPYVPGESEDLSGLFIEYIHDDGTVEIINESRYDPEAKCLIFFVNHLSKFGVAYKPRLFADVPLAHWARGSITFLASRGIIHGASSQRFEPERYISKAEFIQIMANAFSAANVGKKALPSFKDVRADQWYARAVGWTYANNISPTIAYADGRLGVNENIRREDVAVLINNLSLSLGLRIKTKPTAVTFSDTGGAAPYARSAITRISSVGIINGVGSGRFNPKGYCTRAQAAQIVSVLMSSL